MTVSSELERFVEQLQRANRPEDLFGALPNLTTRHDDAHALFKRFARLCHPDLYPDAAEKATAQAAMAQLTAFWVDAQARIAADTYGKTPAKPAIIKTKRSVYTITRALAGGDLANIYQATTESGAEVLVKLGRHHSTNDLLEREEQAIDALKEATARSFALYFPHRIESFTTMVGAEARRANVFQWRPGFVPLTEIVAQYPEGVDPRHGVWIFKRLLTALGYAHQQRLLHGAVLPTHVLVQPETHGLQLIDWAYSVPFGQRIRAISSGYRGWYPPEVLLKHPGPAATQGPPTDILMAARCVAYVLGGAIEDLPESVPRPIRHFLDSCNLLAPNRRPQDAWKLYDLFDGVAADVYGPPRYLKLELQGV